jgi:hypothetical protein
MEYQFTFFTGSLLALLAVYLLYWYKSTNIDAAHPLRVSSSTVPSHQFISPILHPLGGGGLEI